MRHIVRKWILGNYFLGVMLIFLLMVLPYQHHPIIRHDHAMHVYASTRLISAIDIFSLSISNPIAQLLQARHGYFTQLYPFLVYLGISVVGVPLNGFTFDLPTIIAGSGIIYSLYIFERKSNRNKFRAILPALIVLGSSAFIGLSRSFQGNTLFSMFWLIVVLYLIDTRDDYRDIFLYLAVSFYIGSSNDFFIGYFIIFPSYQIAVLADIQGLNVNTIRMGLQDWFLSRWNILPAGVMLSYVLFTYVYLTYFDLYRSGFLIRTFGKTGGPIIGAVDPTLLIFVLGIPLLVVISFSSYEFATSGRLQHFAANPDYRLIVLILASCYSIGLGFIDGVSLYYSVIGIAPLSLAFSRLMGETSDIKVHAIMLIIVITSAPLTSIYLVHEDIEGVEFEFAAYGSVKEADGVRATGYYIRTKQSEGYFDYIGKFQPIASESLDSENNVIVYSSRSLESSNHNGFFYHSIPMWKIPSSNFVNIRSTWKKIQSDNVASGDQPKPKPELIFILYRSDLGTDFNRSVKYLNSQSELSKNLVVKDDNQTVGVVFTSVLNSTESISMEKGARLYETNYHELSHYDVLRFGLY